MLFDQVSLSWQGCDPSLEGTGMSATINDSLAWITTQGVSSTSFSKAGDAARWLTKGSTAVLLLVSRYSSSEFTWLLGRQRTSRLYLIRQQEQLWIVPARKQRSQWYLSISPDHQVTFFSLSKLDNLKLSYGANSDERIWYPLFNPYLGRGGRHATSTSSSGREALEHSSLEGQGIEREKRW